LLTVIEIAVNGGEELSMIPNFKITAGAVCLMIAGEVQAAEAPLADLLAAEPTDAGISVTVPTGGCTKKADFQVNAQPAPDGPAKVEIKRLKRDACKGNFPNGLKLVFTWEDLRVPAGTKLNVVNPVGGPAGKTTIGPKTPRTKYKKLCKRSKSGKLHCRVRRVRHSAHNLPREAGAYAHHHRRYRQRHWVRCDD